MAIVEGTLLDDGGAVFNVMNSTFGATGDGLADDGPAIAAAVAAAAAAGGGVVLLPRVHRVNADLAVGGPTVSVQIPTGGQLLPSLGVTITIDGPLRAEGYWANRTNGGAFLFGPGWDGIVDVTGFGVTGDGTTDEFDNLNAAILSVDGSGGGALVFPPGTYRIANFDLTIPLSITSVLRRGALLRPDSGLTLSIQGTVEAGPWRWIDVSAGGQVLPGQGNATEVVPQWWGAVGDGVTDASPALQAALDALAAAGGGRLRIPAGDYLVETQVNIDGDHIQIDGDGDGTVLRAGSGITLPTQYILELSGGRRNLNVRTLRMIGKGALITDPGGIHGAPDTQEMWIERCTFERFGLAGGTDHSSSFRGGVRDCSFADSWAGCTFSGTLKTHDLAVTGCLFQDVQLAVEVQFGWGCVVMGNTIRYTAAFVRDGVNEVIGIRVMGQRGGRVIGNTIDSRAWTAATGGRLNAAIRLGVNDAAAAQPEFGFPSRCLVHGNHFRGGADVGIDVRGGNDCDVVDNQLETDLNDTRALLVGISLGANTATSPVTYTTRTRVAGNRVALGTLEGLGAVAIREVYAGAAQGNRILDNPRLSGPAATVMIQADAASDVTIRGNVGFVTEAAGTATVGAAATSVAVTTGVERDLAATQITVTPLGSLGAAARFWVDNVNAAARTFDIIVDAAPGGAGVPFAWRVAG